MMNATPSPPNERIIVAAAPPSQGNNSSALATMPVSVAIQMQQQPPPKTNDGREDFWSEGATAVLIDAWGERYLDLSRGNLKQKHWKEVADIVNSREDYTKSAKTDVQCKNRIDTVKKKYKLEKTKISAGAGPSKWPLFDRLDRLIGPVAKNINVVNHPRPAAASSSIDIATSKLPVGIPVGTGRISAPGSNIYQKVRLESVQRSVKKEQIRSQVETESDSDDCWLPPAKKPRAGGDGVVHGGLKAKEKKQGWANSIRTLTQAMLKFGQVYEQAENAKLQQVVEMEKARMKFAKELELQRMQFFMKTQMEISQPKPCTKRGNGNSSNNVIADSNNDHSCSDS